ncbi:hypothetical protein Tco_0972375 [Tanacetum coccineum]
MIWSRPLCIVEVKSCHEVCLVHHVRKFYRSLLCQEEDDVEREDLADDIADVESDYVAEDIVDVKNEDKEEDDVESGISCVEPLVYAVIESQCYSVVAIGKDKGLNSTMKLQSLLKRNLTKKQKRLTELNKVNAKLLKSLKVKEHNIKEFEADKKT